ncbi:SPOR domain-containing protein [uncultured Aquabacterium sp.]|uniref:SPOR domain-containing protein n=1 Tax=Aquabacterium sp. TaxID=1872578 RepID=UPI0025D88F34|nr:SPOR domain-containing protein [uncultured Aquabacterium sp.]
MPLPTFLQRLLRRGPAAQAPAAESLPPSQADIEATRTRARRRLIGMAVLVGAGVIGFPWLFETQPRPLSNDVQVVQAGAPRGVEGGPSTPGRAVAGKVEVAGIVAPQAASPAEDMVEQAEEPSPQDRSRPETADSAPGKATPPLATASPANVADKGAEKAAEEARARRLAEQKAAADKKAAELKEKEKARAAELKLAEQKAADKKAAEQKAAEQKAADQKAAERRQAEARAAASKPADKTDAAGRYIVQIGAFSDATKVQEVRQKVERLGIKTYTQSVDTPDGKRIRVRIGPYADKAEAEKALGSLHKAGLGGNILTL